MTLYARQEHRAVLMAQHLEAEKQLYFAFRAFDRAEIALRNFSDSSRAPHEKENDDE